MQAIKVGRYSNPANIGWQGWIEPADESWILYIDNNGRPMLFAHREEGGAVIGPPAVVLDRESAIVAQREAEEAAETIEPD